MQLEIDGLLAKRQICLYLPCQNFALCSMYCVAGNDRYSVIKHSVFENNAITKMHEIYADINFYCVNKNRQVHYKITLCNEYYYLFAAALHV